MLKEINIRYEPTSNITQTEAENVFQHGDAQEIVDALDDIEVFIPDAAKTIEAFE